MGYIIPTTAIDILGVKAKGSDLRPFQNRWMVTLKAGFTLYLDHKINDVIVYMVIVPWQRTLYRICASHSVWGLSEVSR